MKKIWYNKLRLLLIALALIMLSACSQSAGRAQVKPVVQDYSRHTPGVVEYIWEEPMVNVIDVPPGLDPEGHYYRPAHQAVVEIRQGRWRYYRE